MIDKGPVDDQNNQNKPIKTTDSSSASNGAFNDVEYVEDYLSNTYAKLAKMAQAYSDYGVLDEKKEAKHDNPTPEGQNIERRVKLSVDVPNFQKKFFDRFKKGTTDSHHMNDAQIDFKKGLNIPKFLEKHIKFINASHQPLPLPKTSFSDPDENLKKFLPSTSNKEDIPIPIHTPNKGFKRPLDLLDINTDDASLAKDINKRSIEASDTDTVTDKDSDFFSIEVGMNNNSSSKNCKKPITIDYDFGTSKTKNMFVVATVSAKISSTPQDMNLHEKIAFKHRSLKSIDIETIDKVLGIDDHVTFEDLTTEIVTKYTNQENNISKDVLLKLVNPLNFDDNDTVIGIDANILERYRTELNTIAPFISQFITAIHAPFAIELENITSNPNANESEILGETKTPSDKKYSNDSKINKNLNDYQKSISNIINMVNTQNNTKKSNDGLDLSDFFGMISTWFSSLASASLDDSDDHSGTISPVMKVKTSEIPQVKTIDVYNNTDIHFPNYDSDMIENIGHRSRVLMSVDEVVGAVNITEGNKDIGSIDMNEKDQEKLTPDFQQNNSTDIPEPNGVLTTTKEGDIRTSEKDKNLADNRTLVKRSIGDSGLVFWSDLYDDEYGVKIDLLEKELEEKNGNRGKEFMKRSKNWFQGKVKSIADNIKGFRSNATKSNFKDTNIKNQKKSHVFKRQIKIDKNDAIQEKPSSFAELTIKMRSICKEAAKAVQQTRKMQVRESKDDTVANGLMQQLVRMMSDLVDFQVKQKTCVKLPADLHNFLEWITSPNQDKPSNHQINLQDNVLDDEQYGKDQDGASPLMIQDKAECLETLRAVEDLLQQYDQMDDEDKSKMSGVRQYLENQQDFLNKQISLLDEYNFSNMYANQQPLRFRRHLTKKPESNRNRIKRRMRRRLGDFFRNFRKKQNRSSTLSSDITHITESSTIHDKKDIVDEKYHKSDVNTVLHKDVDKQFGENAEVANNNLNAHKRVDTIDKKKNNLHEDYIMNLNSNKNNEKYVSDKGFDGDFAENYDVLKNVDGFDKNENFDTKMVGIQGMYNKNERAERNLQDVYYRALNEAKKVTTVKNDDKNA